MNFAGNPVASPTTGRDARPSCSPNARLGHVRRPRARPHDLRTALPGRGLRPAAKALRHVPGGRAEQAADGEKRDDSPQHCRPPTSYPAGGERKQGRLSRPSIRQSSRRRDTRGDNEQERGRGCYAPTPGVWLFGSSEGPGSVPSEPPEEPPKARDGSYARSEPASALPYPAKSTSFLGHPPLIGAKTSQN